jgi:Zn-dependent peptidase ImmA (M78 family)
VLEEGAVEKDDSGQHLAKQRPWYPPEELEANQFGAAILMPAELVRAARERFGQELNAMATAFGVSTMAMERRLWFLSR